MRTANLNRNSLILELSQAFYGDLKETIYSIDEFETLINKNEISSNTGDAKLMISGEIDEFYIVDIDEKQVIKRGSGVVSFSYLEKMYGKRINIVYYPKFG